MRERLRRLADRPALCVALLAAAFRLAMVAHAWHANPMVRSPQLDGGYYLGWARDVAGGDLVGTGGTIGGKPWVLNPLYAYAIAPLVGLLAEPLPWILACQAVLGGATAGLAAAAAARFFGARGGWAAGVLVALSAPLAQLDAHLSVAELAAFLVAGACLACAPPRDAGRGAARAPWAAGLWLGVGALARPVTPLALPLVAWRFARESPRRLRTAAIVVAAFAACALPSLARNWIVSGEPAVYTAAGGINLHLGNNPLARTTRSMISPHFRFDPVSMHEDGRRYVHEAIGRRPTPSEVGSWFARMALEEALVRAPGGSLVFYAHKARWFLSPVEIPSSASLAVDRGFAPWLAAACVPSWLVGALAVAGAWAGRKRRDLLLGPGALAAAHWAMLTLVFPLSHYRAPAIPALAVLAAGAVVAVLDAWPASRARAAGVVLVAAGAAAAGALPPQPDSLRFRDRSVLAIFRRDQGDLDAAERHAREAIEVYRSEWGRDLGLGWEILGEIQFRRRDWPEALRSFDRSLELDPTPPHVRVFRSWVHESLGDFASAERDAREVARRYPLLPDGHMRLAELLSRFPDRREEAVRELRAGTELGAEPDDDTLRRLGLRR